VPATVRVVASETPIAAGNARLQDWSNQCSTSALLARRHLDRACEHYAPSPDFRS